MRRYVVYAVPLLIMAGLAVLFYRGLHLSPSYIPSPLIGKELPAFELPSLTDPAATVSSEDIKGQVALFNVWATWCIECRHEHPFLVELARDGVAIYGLNWKDDRDLALDWLATLGNPYVASAVDDEGRVAIDYGVYAAPETFLIGRDGTILHKHISPLTPEVWRRDFLPLIQKECGSLPCPLVERE